MNRATITSGKTVGQALSRALPPADPAMNKTEARFAGRLELLRLKFLIREWRYQPIKLRLASGCWYTPDFRVIWHDGVTLFIEVKGCWKAPHQEDSRVKLKVVAEEYTDALWLAYEDKHQLWEWFGPHRNNVGACLAIEGHNA